MTYYDVKIYSKVDKREEETIRGLSYAQKEGVVAMCKREGIKFLVKEITE